VRRVGLHPSDENGKVRNAVQVKGEAGDDEFENGKCHLRSVADRLQDQADALDKKGSGEENAGAEEGEGVVEGVAMEMNQAGKINKEENEKRDRKDEENDEKLELGLTWGTKEDIGVCGWHDRILYHMLIAFLRTVQSC
jgi:hypothetical protein